MQFSEFFLKLILYNRGKRQKQTLDANLYQSIVEKLTASKRLEIKPTDNWCI